jgi:glycosyltransferase involved in cell wall biosynthesis
VAVAKLFGVMDLVHTEWPALKYWFKNAEQIAGMMFPQDAWIILDDGTRGDEAARARGIPAERIHFLPNGIDLDWRSRDVDRRAARAHFGIGDDARVALFLARLVESKRPAEAIRAMATVAAGSAPAGMGDAVLVIAGDGPERERAQTLSRDLGLGGNVRFLGPVPHEDVPRLMAAADVFVSTSNLTNKALPTCEALVCGVPVVAYDVGDTAAVVRSGESGVLVRDGDTAALASALTSILDDPAARARMSAAARRVAADTFTGWRERVEMELEIFERLVGEKEKRAAE